MQHIERKTLEEHMIYVEQMARISFFAAKKMKESKPEEPISELIKNYTPLFYHALNYLDNESGWDNPDCIQISLRANELQYLGDKEFEEEMTREFKFLFMERAKLFYPESVGMALPKGWNVQSLKYDPPHKELPSNYCCFHIANALAPYSIYSDPLHLPRCFMELMDRSEKEYGYDTLYTGSWLNDTPRWNSLFPQEWETNLSPYNNFIAWHFGCWGQLVTARGTFNEKAAEYVRENCKLKYEMRTSHCSFESMREHIRVSL